MTTDLRELLRTTAAEAGTTVDLAEDAVADRIRHRRTRTRRLTVGSTALAAAVVIAGTTWAVRPGDGHPPAVSGPTTAADPPRIVTADFDNLNGMQAGLPATLTADANGCVRPSAQSDITLVWPRGYTVHGDSTSFEILDTANKVVARSGTPIIIGGGGTDRFRDTWTARGLRNRRRPVDSRRHQCAALANGGCFLRLWLVFRGRGRRWRRRRGGRGRPRGICRGSSRRGPARSPRGICRRSW
jgi:hypothetical protein